MKAIEYYTANANSPITVKCFFCIRSTPPLCFAHIILRCNKQTRPYRKWSHMKSTNMLMFYHAATYNNQHKYYFLVIWRYDIPESKLQLSCVNSFGTQNMMQFLENIYINICDKAILTVLKLSRERFRAMLN